MSFSIQNSYSGIQNREKNTGRVKIPFTVQLVSDFRGYKYTTKDIDYYSSILNANELQKYMSQKVQNIGIVSDYESEKFHYDAKENKWKFIGIDSKM